MFPLLSKKNLLKIHFVPMNRSPIHRIIKSIGISSFSQFGVLFLDQPIQGARASTHLITLCVLN